jgi:hypothetical protein
LPSRSRPPAAPSFSPEPDSPAPVVPHGATLAVVVGIDNYGDPAINLRSSVNDARTVDAALGRAGVDPRDRRVLTDGDATATQIRAALHWLAASSTPNTTAVFFFAGHAKHVGPAEAIVSADGEAITDNELAALLRPNAAEHMWIGMATCYGGGFTELLAPGRVLTAAADATHEAYENDKLGRSYLVDSLVRHGLNNDFSTASIQDAFAKGTTELARTHADRLPVLESESAAPVIVVAP